MSYHKSIRFSISVTCALSVISLAMSVNLALGQDRTMRIDFGLNTQQTTATGWNNFKGILGDKPTTTLNLVDSSGAATGITLVPSWSVIDDDVGVAGTAANYDGPYPTEVSTVPQSALRDSIYVRDGQSLTLTLNNLPANARYDFLLYGAAGNTGDYSLYTVTGSNSGQDHITPLVNNSAEVATINGILPDAMQKIAVLFEGRRPDGSAHLIGVNGDGLGRLNYLQIVQHTLPPAGDYNNDMMVNSADYAVWQTNFGSETVLGADGNGNGVVDAGDYVVWRNAMAPPAVPGSASSVPAVPEPVTSTLILSALVSWSAVTFRRGQR